MMMMRLTGKQVCRQRAGRCHLVVPPCSHKRGGQGMGERECSRGTICMRHTNGAQRTSQAVEAMCNEVWWLCGRQRQSRGGRLAVDGLPCTADAEAPRGTWTRPDSFLLQLGPISCVR